MLGFKDCEEMSGQDRQRVLKEMLWASLGFKPSGSSGGGPEGMPGAQTGSSGGGSTGQQQQHSTYQFVGGQGKKILFSRAIFHLMFWYSIAWMVFSIPMVIMYYVFKGVRRVLRGIVGGVVGGGAS